MAWTATTDLRQVYSSRLTDVLRNRLVFTNLCNRDFQAELQRAYEVKIPTYNESQITVDDNNTITRGKDFRTALNDTQITTSLFTPDKSWEVAAKIRLQDEVQTNVNLLAQTATVQARKIAEVIDKNVAAIMVGGVSTSNPDHQTESAATTIVKKDGKSYTNNTTLASTPYDEVHAAFERVSLESQAEALAGPAGITSTSVWAVMEPYLFAQLRAYALAQKWPTDALTTGMLVNASVGPRTRGYAGRWLGIDIILSNTVPTATNVSGTKKYGQIIFGTREATTFASTTNVTNITRPTDPGASGIYTVIRRYGEYDAKVQYPARLWVHRIRQEA